MNGACLDNLYARLIQILTSLSEIGIWIAYPTANVIAAIITLFWFAKGTWKRKNITNEIKVRRETIIEDGLN